MNVELTKEMMEKVKQQIGEFKLREPAHWDQKLHKLHFYCHDSKGKLRSVYFNNDEIWMLI